MYQIDRDKFLKVLGRDISENVDFGGMSGGPAITIVQTPALRLWRSVDATPRDGIVMITRPAQHALESRGPPRGGHAESGIREGPRSEVSRRGFFDPRDAVQVRYEMLRRVSSENASVTDASDEYGVSRPTYYQAKSNFHEAGIAGLVPKKRGPHGPHKIHGEVLAFLRTQFVPGEPIRARALARLIRQEFGLDVHPRTIERAVSGKKNATLISETAAECSPRLSAAIAQYDTLRMATLGEALPVESRSGLALFLRRGMWGWARTLATTSPRPMPISATPPGPMESRDRSVIIHVFADGGKDR